MQIFNQIARGNATDTTDTTNDCKMMSYSHVEKNRNEHLKLNLEENTSLTVACFSQNNFYFSQNKLRA